MWRTEIPHEAEPVGYRALVEMFDLKVPPHYRWSYVSKKWEKREVHFEDPHLSLHIYPPSYRIQNDPYAHMEFALKNEGINLSILKETLLRLPEESLKAFITKNPTGKYVRIIWYLYENFFQKRINLPDLGRGSYIPILNPKKYYTTAPHRSPRHRVADNLLGTLDFCPVVRKTVLLDRYEKKELRKVIHALVASYDKNLLDRAMRYLYTKETLASWEIEREKPDSNRVRRFTALLQKAEFLPSLSKEVLISLQKEIVDPRFALEEYRDFQNYVGEEPGLRNLIVHYISPKPEDIALLMKGLLGCYERLQSSSLSPVVVAAVLSFGFVFLHPFWDGNGRLHRFLVHYVLARSGFSPSGLVFPVSAVILREPRRYDTILESISKPIVDLIEAYSVDDTGRLVVQQETALFYQYPDYTLFAEFLFECVERTITIDFKDELQFLHGYDLFKRKAKEIVDMPDQSIDLFLRCVRQNGGTLSAKKREKYFHMLSDEEIRQMEEAIKNECASE